MIFRRPSSKRVGCFYRRSTVDDSCVRAVGDKGKDYGVHNKSFIEEENIGAIPLLPGTDGTKVLYEFLDYVLKHQDAHAHLDAVIPTRGTTMVVGKGFAGDDVLDVEVPPNQWDAYIRSSNLELSFEELCGRTASSIQFVRFRCPNHLPLMVKVKLHSAPVGQADGTYSFSITLTPPNAQ